MKKILIADDSMIMRTILKKLLCKKYKLIESKCGTEALEEFKKEKPDLLLLDIVMPKKGGVKVLKTLMELNPKAKIVMVSAVGDNAMINKCRKIGVKDYIVKPFDEDEILSTVNRLLK